MQISNNLTSEQLKNSLLQAPFQEPRGGGGTTRLHKPWVVLPSRSSGFSEGVPDLGTRIPGML